MKGNPPTGDDSHHALIEQLAFVLEQLARALRERLQDERRKSIAADDKQQEPLRRHDTPTGKSRGDRESLEELIEPDTGIPSDARQTKSPTLWTLPRNGVERRLQRSRPVIRKRVVSLRIWMDEATSAFPYVEFFSGFVAVIAVFVPIFLTDRTQIVIVAKVMVVFALVLFSAHWRIHYLRDVKEKPRDLRTMRVVLVACFGFGVAIVGDVVNNSQSARVAIARIVPFPQGFLGPPLACGDPGCDFTYSQGVYTSSTILSVLDHSLKQNANGVWQNGTLRDGGGNGVIMAFNGEIANGTPSGPQPKCIGGIIHLQPAPAVTDMVMNPSPCGTGFASYDESPGYDYRAEMRTPVRAAAAGVVVNNHGVRCIQTIASSCARSNFVGIDHGNGYFSQYGYLSTISVKAGERVSQGQRIGLTGNKDAATPCLHFEVLKLIPGRQNNFAAANYAVVDPYGWVGGGTDPLYSVELGIPPTKLWQ